jgi:hypothetical protein
MKNAGQSIGSELPGVNTIIRAMLPERGDS